MHCVLCFRVFSFVLEMSSKTGTKPVIGSLVKECETHGRWLAAYLRSAVLDFTLCIISSLMCFTVLESAAAKPECDAGVSTSG